MRLPGKLIDDPRVSLAMDGEPSNERHCADRAERPPLPSHLSGDELLSPSNLVPMSPKHNEPLLRRKPVIPRRSSRQSLDARSYSPIQMKQMGTSPASVDGDAEEDSKSGPLPPKAFRKTHKLLGCDFGYWRMPVRHFSIFSVVFLGTFLPVWYGGKGFSTIQPSFDGPFQFDCTGSDSSWSWVGINIRFGKFQYGEAKTIDLLWNWIVGRGLQGLMAFVAYRVFQDALLRVTELTPLPYELYATLALYSTKVDILWQLSKGLLRFGNWRTKLIFIWLLFSTVYLAVFPSLMDLCSGYDAAYGAADFQWPNGTLTNTDGLVNWANDSAVVVGTTDGCCVGNETMVFDHTAPCYVKGVDVWPEQCEALPIDFNAFVTLYYWQDPDLNRTFWNEYKKHDMNAMQDFNWQDWGFAPANQSNFKCIAQNNTYQWGFSFEWLFVAAVVNIIWLYGLWGVWLDCDINSELCKKGRRLGLWRAIADISEAMRDELGPNICAYTEKELADALKDRPAIKYHASNGTGDEPGHIGLSSQPSGRLRLQWNQDYGKKTFK